MIFLFLNLKVYDQYLNFISLEEDMFILRHQNSDDISYYGNYYYTLPTLFFCLLKIFFFTIEIMSVFHSFIFCF